MKKFIIIQLFVMVFFFCNTVFAETKQADLAGGWYPSGPKELTDMLDSYLAAASVPKIEGKMLGIISPHAGFVYSAPVAAYGYKLLSQQPIDIIIILGFSHRKYFDGISIYPGGEFQTPLGNLKVDEETASLIKNKSDRIKFYPELFINENSIETQLPFIKKVLPDVKIVPVAFGDSNYENAKILSEILAEMVKDRDDIAIVASTDMSHFKVYDEASHADNKTINLMKQFNYNEIYQEGISDRQPCCGYMPVTCLLMVAKHIGANGFEVLKYANSGDTTADKSRVVGYLSAVVYKSNLETKEPKNQKTGQTNVLEDKGMLNEVQKKRLLQIAREAITSYVRDGKRKIFTESDPVLNKPIGAFVTLHKNGRLRGCIGNLIAQGPLYKTVADMAIESATGDPRFPTLSKDEIDNVDIEISALSILRRVKDASQIKIPGHGVLVRNGFRSGVYLPQVAAETGWTKEEFLSSLCASKAGIKADAWKEPDTELYIFTAEIFKER